MLRCSACGPAALFTRAEARSDRHAEASCDAGTRAIWLLRWEQQDSKRNLILRSEIAPHSRGAFLAFATAARAPRGGGGGGAPRHHGGAEIGGGGRTGWEEGAEASRAQNGPSSTGRVRVASETLISAGRTRILGSALNFLLPFPSFEGADLRHFLARTHNWRLF
jgi:hypothetical protein